MSAAKAKDEATVDETAPEQGHIEAAGDGNTPATEQQTAIAKVVQTEPRAVADGDAALVTAHDEVGEELIELGEATHVTLNKDVVEEFYFPDTKRPSYRVKYHAGQVVSRRALEEHNANVRARIAARERGGEPDPANPAGIDSTTLASGTFPGLVGAGADQK